ncbi:MAG TPA: M28 family peptidase [Nonomuraea sp.]|nr:M28 family peptidase [Nonomuraea sp.]
MNGVARSIAVCALIGLCTAAALSAAAPPNLPNPASPDAGGESWIAVFPAEQEAALREAGVPIWDREEDVVIAGPSDSQFDAVRAQGVSALFSIPDNGEALHILSYDRFFTPPNLPGLRYRINAQAILYLLPAGTEMKLPRLKLHGLFHGVPRVPLSAVRPHAADIAAAASGPLASITAALPLVQQIVNATSQASWFQFVRDLSGDADVTIPGFCTACRIRTRASNYMFPPNNTGNPLGNPFASEYLEMKASGWGFTGANAVRESYTSATSGCTTGQGSQTWQNLVFTLPAQVDYAQNQQVIFLVHYDTISESAANDANKAPGADDAISGGGALLEAMRLFKGYAWRYPVKFLFVSGEEVGLCGSTAYTRMHPTASMWRVLNMDQTAFDGNKNGLMNLYNWSTASCPSCVAFGDAFVQANADYGSIIAPAKIVRNTTKMCQTDHCPFWNVGVTAIDLNEDLTNNDICPCFDQSQTSTCRDTVTQFYPVGSTTLMFDQAYSWPTEKAAIALIAHTAEPLYACPASGATLSATAGTGQVALSWQGVAGVTNYVVERAAGGCGGTFSGIASTTTGSYTDTAVTSGSTYGYRIRTCPFQVSNCVAATPAAGANFTIAASPASLTVVRGNSGNSTITTAVSGGFNNAVALSATGQPAGVTVSFTPSSIAAPGAGTSTMTMAVASSTATGTYTITVTGTGGTTSHTTTVTLTVSSGSSQLLGNPGFETGTASPWVASSGVVSNSASQAPHSGTWYAWLDGYGTTHTDTLYQDVTIPSTATSATLTFWLHIDSAETTTTTAFDTLKAQVRNTSNTVLATLATYSNLNKATGYTQKSFNLIAYKGQTIRIYFLGAEDSSAQTSFVIDDTALTVQ